MGHEGLRGSKNLYHHGFLFWGNIENRKDFFRYAASFDEQFRYGERTSQLSEVVKWFGLWKGDLVLDVGTGIVSLLPLMKEAIGTSGRIIAVDFSFKMLEEAKSRPSPEKKDPHQFKRGVHPVSV